MTNTNEVKFTVVSLAVVWAGLAGAIAAATQRAAGLPSKCVLGPVAAHVGWLAM